MTSRFSRRHRHVSNALHVVISAADLVRRFWLVTLICLVMFTGAAVWLASAVSARSWAWKSWERLFGSPAQSADTGSAALQARPDDTGTNGLNITPFDDSSAGTGTLEGTLGTAINASGEVAGMYSNSMGVVHGLVRDSSGNITNFDAAGAGSSPPPGSAQGTIPTAIDSAGNVAGVYIDANNASHGFLHTAADGMTVEFNAPGASSAANRGTSAMAMNDSDQIVGFYTTGSFTDPTSTYHGFRRDADGTFITIDAPGAGTGESSNGRKQGTSAAAINASGVIAGTYIDSNNARHGFVRSTDGTITSFDPPGSTSFTGTNGGFAGTEVMGIDAAGDIVGAYTDANMVRHGYVRAGNGAITSFDVPGATTSTGSGTVSGTFPIGIDPGGNYIVGTYADSSGLNHGFVYTQPLSAGGTIIPFSAPNAATAVGVVISGTAAAGVNTSGEIVGAYIDSSNVGHGFVTSVTTQGVPVATPTFSPASGTYTSAQSVTISDVTPGATIYYTTNGTTPTTGSTLYTGPITVSSSETIEAIATASGYSQSAVATATYTINSLPAAATPTFTPSGGTFSTPQTVTISDTTTGATIYYTTNGSMPTTSSAVYSSPITVSSSETIEAIATASGYAASTVATATFTISSGGPGTYTTLVNFNGGNGATPFTGSLIQGTDGNFYGTTTYGGAYSRGTVFKITPGGNLTTLYSFCSQSGCTDGAGPFGGLTLAANGMMYGTTGGGGANQCTYGTQAGGCGTIFQISPSGVLTTLYNFAGGDGYSPTAPLVEGIDGDLYGSTEFGGAYNEGTLFKISPAGSLTSLYSNCNTSGCPAGVWFNPLTLGADGNFYGTTEYTIFKATSQGAVTTLDALSGSEGDGIYAALVQAANGNFYGAASSGGNGATPSCDKSGGEGSGTLFEIAPGGTLTNLYTFQNSTDGATPDAALIQASDGNLYGTTACGGANGAGTIFSVTPAGAFTPLYSFAAPAAVGAGAQGGLFQGTNGSFYGMTPAGGTYNQGTIFSFSLGLAPFVEMVPSFGGVRSQIQILGTNLAGATAVSFNGTAATFTIASGSEILATVPAGATTGFVQVTTPSGTLTSNQIFQVATQAAPPVFSPGAGTYASAQSVTISDATPGATIYYTTNNSTPTTSSTVYSSPITVSSSQTIEAIAAAGGYSQSAVATAAYLINPPAAATPTFSPPGGTYSTAQPVTISDATPGAIIHYTTNGATPTYGSPIYVGPIVVSSPETLKAIAMANGYSPSAVASAAYIVTLQTGQSTTVYAYKGNNYGAVTGVTCGGNYCTGGPYALTVTFTTTLTGSALTNLALTDITSTVTSFKLTDGSGLVDDNSSTSYKSFQIATDGSGNIVSWLIETCGSTCNIQMQTNWHTLYSFQPGADFSETTASFAGSFGFVSGNPGTWTQTVGSPIQNTSAPTFSPSAGTYASAQTVTISDATSGAAIYYTTNGTAPTPSSTVYSGPINVATTETIEAIAVASGYATSAVASATYTISNPVAATPTFSPAAGTYASAQTVTISDATSGATIYYTTNGTTPTTSSTVYSGPITVSSSETIEAIATATGYATSAVASAAYAISIAGFGPPGGSQPGSISIEPGATTGNTATISVVGTNGFSGTVNLSCSIAPAAANDPPTCSLSPASVTLSGTTVQTSTLSVSTTAPTSADGRPEWRNAGGIAFAIVVLLAVPRRRRSWLAMTVLLALIVSGGVLGCGGGSSHSNGNSGTTPGTYTLTVTGTSGSISAAITTVTLTVQ